jgi:hypothetical protein
MSTSEHGTPMTGTTSDVPLAALGSGDVRFSAAIADMDHPRSEPLRKASATASFSSARSSKRLVEPLDTLVGLFNAR